MTRLTPSRFGECRIFRLFKLSLNFGQPKYFRQRNNAGLMMTSS
ncbi:hypothetical protein [Rhizobium croatiense]|nr:hypothetical protein [Rhizobium croatiense]